MKLIGRKVGRPSKIEKHIMNLENKSTNEDSEYSEETPILINSYKESDSSSSSPSDNDEDKDPLNLSDIIKRKKLNIDEN